ncbi:MAG: alanine racemase, partial [Pseudomonadota bacterium]|nr:alanine racemase [Pseudomonadota bacterium]
MSLPEPPRASLSLRIDTDALVQNWRALDTLSGTAKAGAAVKADCYGLGAALCVPALREAGCEDFFVAHWTEAAEVAQYVDPKQIAVLHGPVTAADASFARANGMVPVINSVEQARIWTQAGGGACHLMVDTGINRLGIAPSELGEDAIRQLKIDALMSHLASADEDLPSNKAQKDALASLSGSIAHKRMSLANSAGIALGSDFAFDLTRPGLALYGGVPRPELAGTIAQVAYPQAQIIQTRTLSAGDQVGYNAEFTATKTMRVGTVSIGYADGFLRSRGP